MAVDLSTWGDEERTRLVERVAVLVHESAFRKPATWPAAVVVLEEKRVTSRGCFAAWLRANDLGVAARECTGRKLRRGEVLVWISADAAAWSGFLVLDLRGEILRLPAMA